MIQIKIIIVFIFILGTVARDNSTFQLTYIPPFPESRPDHKTWLVTITKGDNGGLCDTQCSLQDAVSQAQTGDVIEFSPTIVEPIEITSSVDIINKYIEIRAIKPVMFKENERSIGEVFIIHSGAGLRISFLQFSGNRGSIFNNGLLYVNKCTFENQKRYSISIREGYTQIENSTFANNESSGVSNVRGSVNIINSTFYNFDYQGALRNYQGEVTVVNSTFVNSQNRLGDSFLTSYGLGGRVYLANSIMIDTHNWACNGNFIDKGGNIQFPDQTCGSDIVSIDPKVMLIADNGGTTWTMGLLPGSLAIGNGNSIICRLFARTDQRGVDRFANGDTQCNSGAYED